MAELSELTGLLARLEAAQEPWWEGDPDLDAATHRVVAGGSGKPPRYTISTEAAWALVGQTLPGQRLSGEPTVPLAILVELVKALIGQKMPELADG